MTCWPRTRPAAFDHGNFPVRDRADRLRPLERVLADAAHRAARRIWLTIAASLCGLFVLLSLTGQLAAAEHRNGFDDEQTSWEAKFDQRRVRVVSHRRHPFIFVRGRASEAFEFDIRPSEQRVRLEHTIPAARVIEDLMGSIWVKSNQAGWTVKLRVVFPHQRDPRTKAVLSTLISGESYTRRGEWQMIKCDQVGTRVREQLVRLRALLKEPFLNKRDLYIDRIIIDGDLVPGPSEILVDELRVNPLVHADKTVTIKQVADERVQEKMPVEFRLDQLLTDGKPIFPRIIPLHGESAKVMHEAGANVLLIPNAQNHDLIRQIKDAGFWVAATPPRAQAGDGSLLSDRSASLLPFGSEMDGVLFWYLGTRIKPDQQQQLAEWTEQIQSADKSHRPIAGDVLSAERVYSRHLSMLGVSRHVLNTTFSIRDYRDWLIQKRKMALPGTFVWTWIQTEAASSNIRRRKLADDIPIVIEPEQIRLQAYAALSAGCRGIGYWKTGKLDADGPGALERRLMLSIVNTELDLLGPWLATGQPAGDIVVYNSLEQSREAQEKFSLSNLASGFRSRDDKSSAKPRLKHDIEAAIISCEKGRVVLPLWLQRDAQFVPAQMSTERATMVVPGVPDSASAWEVTPTGVRSLGRERGTGGIVVSLSELDQVAAIIVTSDRAAIEELRRKVLATAEPTARLWIELAKAKRARVLDISQRLDKLGAGVRDADRLAAQSSRLLHEAESAIGRRDYHSARIFATRSLRMLRILQRAHWLKATSRHASPISSPHLTCFQTLPDHWRMVSEIGRSSMKPDTNLLLSGGFEDFDTMIVDGWEHAQNIIDGVKASAELKTDRQAKQGKSTLRLVAGVEAKHETPRFIEHSPVVVTTPPVTVEAGQILHISGWIKLNTPVIGSRDGVMIYDSITGPLGAIRWREKSDWQRIELIREVYRTEPFRLTISLNGLGDVQLDDLRIVPHTPVDRPSESAKAEAEPKSLRENLLNRLQRLNPIQ